MESAKSSNLGPTVDKNRKKWLQFFVPLCTKIEKWTILKFHCANTCQASSSDGSVEQQCSSPNNIWICKNPCQSMHKKPLGDVMVLLAFLMLYCKGSAV